MATAPEVLNRMAACAAACAALVLCLVPARPAGAQTTQPAAATTQATTSEAQTQPAESAGSTWPPGLIMDGLTAVGVGQPMQDFGFRIYGFVETGFTGRLTGGQDPLPLRGFEARRVNDLRLNELWLTAERGYDSNKAFDVGGRISGFYGGDAMLTKARGLFPFSGEDNGDNWADLFEGYGQFWFKTGDTSGLEVTVGKWASPMGYEPTDAAHTVLYSHSYIFNFATPFTHTGVRLNYVINPEYSAYFAVVNGWDDFADNNNAVSYMAGGAWNSADKTGAQSTNSLSLCVMTGPEQVDNVNNKRTGVDTYFTHWWNEKLSQTLEINFGTEEEAPLADGSEGRAWWYGSAHYLSYTFCDYVTGVWRAEWLRDDGGSRTGFSGSVFENTWGLTVTPCPADNVLKNLSLRPEIRWDFACDPAFGDEHRNQLTAAIDLIFKF
jgi:hypothetical protein